MFGRNLQQKLFFIWWKSTTKMIIFGRNLQQKLPYSVDIYNKNEYIWWIYTIKMIMFG